MAKRARLVSKEDGTVETSGSKYNCKYILGNVLVCGDCSASYRRRTERGKDVYPHSPTLDEGWIQDTLSIAICQNGAYDESIIRNEVNKIQGLDTYILIFRMDRSQEKRQFRND